jgi:hypothetical protein
MSSTKKGAQRVQKELNLVHSSGVVRSHKSQVTSLSQEFGPLDLTAWLNEVHIFLEHQYICTAVIAWWRGQVSNYEDITIEDGGRFLMDTFARREKLGIAFASGT